MRTQLLILAASLGVTAPAVCEEKGKYSSAAEKAADERRERILAEVKKLGAHDWAGEYYEGNGHGSNMNLTVAPEAGYVIECYATLGTYDRNYGPVTMRDGRLRLSFTFENRRDGFHGIAPEFVLVPWGSRRYLVPADDIVGFCNRVNQGREPRSEVCGSYLLRDGDEKKEVAGGPELPREFRDYLLARPVEATIVSIGKTTIRPSVTSWDFKDTQVTLSAGDKQCLKVGMELIVTEPRAIPQWVTLTKVESERSEGVLTRYLPDEPAPKTGWKLSTRAPWHAEKRKDSSTKDE
jgi:hypothetical protein